MSMICNQVEFNPELIITLNLDDNLIDIINTLPNNIKKLQLISKKFRYYQKIVLDNLPATLEELTLTNFEISNLKLNKELKFLKANFIKNLDTKFFIDTIIFTRLPEFYQGFNFNEIYPNQIIIKINDRDYINILFENIDYRYNINFNTEKSEIIYYKFSMT